MAFPAECGDMAINPCHRLLDAALAWQSDGGGHRRGSFDCFHSHFGKFMCPLPGPSETAVHPWPVPANHLSHLICGREEH